MADRVELKFIGFVTPSGEVLLANGAVIPAQWRSLADSETVLEAAVTRGDFVANADFSIAGVVTSTGYVKLKDTNNPADVGIHKTASVSQIVGAGFFRVSAEEFANQLKLGQDFTGY